MIMYHMEDIMTKKLIAALLAVFALLSFTACVSSSSGSVDESSAGGVVNIENYLKDAEQYFSVMDTAEAFKDANGTEDLLSLYIEKATAVNDPPDGLVNSYIESYKNYFGDTSDDETLRESAKNLIKTEMVIYIAAKKFGINDEITAEDEAAMAKTLADKYGVDESALYTEGDTNYIVKSAIREERVKEKFQEIYSSHHNTSTAE